MEENFRISHEKLCSIKNYKQLTLGEGSPRAFRPGVDLGKLGLSPCVEKHSNDELHLKISFLKIAEK